MCALLWCLGLFCFFFKQKTAYEMRISDWSSDVCSSDLIAFGVRQQVAAGQFQLRAAIGHVARRERHVVVRRQIDVDRFADIEAGFLGVCEHRIDRKSVVSGTSVSVRVDLGGRRIIKKKIEIKKRQISS